MHLSQSKACFPPKLPLPLYLIIKCTARYTGLPLAPLQCFGLWPKHFLASRQSLFGHWPRPEGMGSASIKSSPTIQNFTKYSKVQP